MLKHRSKAYRRLQQDVVFLIISLIAAILLARSGAVENIIQWSRGFDLFATLIAGFFFTSVFTTVPAMVMLAELSHIQHIMLTAAIGAIGATIGDFLIFTLARNRLTDDLTTAFRKFFHHRTWLVDHARAGSWWLRILGALIIASPLPDEIGLTMLGLSKARMELFLPLALIVNFLGIVVIGFTAQSLGK